MTTEPKPTEAEAQSPWGNRRCHGFGLLYDPMDPNEPMSSSHGSAPETQGLPFRPAVPSPERRMRRLPAPPPPSAS